MKYLLLPLLVCILICCGDKKTGTAFTSEPQIGHHDILRKDGTPFSEEEVAFLKEITSEKQ